MDSVIRRLEPDEAISPELVLVDPALAHLARQRLPDAPPWQPLPRLDVVREATSTPVEPWRALAAPTTAIPQRRALLASSVGAFVTAIPALLLGAVAVGMVASEVQAQLLDDPIALVAPSSPPTTTRPEQAPSVDRRPSHPRYVAPAPARTPGRRIPSTSEVEARVLAVLLQRGVGTIPIALIDPRSGLLANNAYAACRRAGRTRRFDCRLGIGLGRGDEWLLTVVVAKDGAQKLSWRGPAAQG